MLASHYDQNASTYRQGFVLGSTIKKTYNLYLSDIPCLIQPLDSALGETIPGGFSKSWLMICDIVDLQEADKIVIDSIEYRIAGIETFAYGHTPHQEVTIKTFKE